MKKFLNSMGITILALLFLVVPFLSPAVVRIEAAGPHFQPATYHYSYRYYRPVQNPGSRQCYWLYTNGAYVYVCR